MMCSSWKISVFGIVALMLIFGLNDATAHDPSNPGETGDHTVDVGARHVKHHGRATFAVTASSETPDGAAARDSSNDDVFNLVEAERLRATEKLTSLVFTYTLSPDEAGRKGTVVIDLPSGWRGAFLTDDAADPDDWAVPVLDSKDPRAGGTITGDGGNAKLSVAYNRFTATIDHEDAESGNTIEITYRNVRVPKGSAPYEFTVTSNLVDKNVHTTALGAPVDDTITDSTVNRGIVIKSGKSKYRIQVYGVQSGKGKVELSRLRGTFYKGGDEAEKVYKDHYLVSHKDEALGTLLLKFTTPGTMFKSSQVRITVPEGWTEPQSDNGGAADPGEVRVRSGKVKVELGGDGDRQLTVTLTSDIQADKSFEIAYMKVTSPGNHEEPDAATTYVFETATSSLATAADDPLDGAIFTSAPSFSLPDDSEIPSVGKEPVVTVTARHGVGTLRLLTDEVADDENPVKYAMAGEEVKRLNFRFGGDADDAKTGSAIGMAAGGQVKIEFDSAWPPPFDATRAEDERLGAVFTDATNVTLKSENGVVTATLI